MAFDVILGFGQVELVSAQQNIQISNARRIYIFSNSERRKKYFGLESPKLLLKKHLMATGAPKKLCFLYVIRSLHDF